MVFTDEDLRRLKLRLSADYFVRNKFVDAQDMEALLARLEAAERVCDAWGDSAGGTITQAAWHEWRKAAGKGA